MEDEILEIKEYINISIEDVISEKIDYASKFIYYYLLLIKYHKYDEINRLILIIVNILNECDIEHKILLKLLDLIDEPMFKKLYNNYDYKLNDALDRLEELFIDRTEYFIKYKNYVELLQKGEKVNNIDIYKSNLNINEINVYLDNISKVLKK